MYHKVIFIRKVRIIFPHYFLDLILTIKHLILHLKSIISDIDAIILHRFLIQTHIRVVWVAGMGPQPTYLHGSRRS